jgi:hypothetical protein
MQTRGGGDPVTDLGILSGGDTRKIVEEMKMKATMPLMAIKDLLNNKTGQYQDSTKEDWHKIQETKGEVIFH